MSRPEDLTRLPSRKLLLLLLLLLVPVVLDEFAERDTLALACLACILLILIQEAESQCELDLEDDRGKDGAEAYSPMSEPQEDEADLNPCDPPPTEDSELLLSDSSEETPEKSVRDNAAALRRPIEAINAASKAGTRSSHHTSTVWPPMPAGTSQHPKNKNSVKVQFTP